MAPWAPSAFPWRRLWLLLLGALLGPEPSVGLPPLDDLPLQALSRPAAVLQDAAAEGLEGASLLQHRSTHVDGSGVTPYVAGPFQGVLAGGQALASWSVNAHASVEEADTPGGVPIPPQCGVNHTASEQKPLAELAKEHPSEDLFCYFGYLGLWASLCAVARERRDYMKFALGISYAPLLATSGSYSTVTYEGGTFKTRNILFLYDDIYCHANGWLRGQRLPQARKNHTAWAEVQAAECAQLAQFQFPQSDLSIEDMIHRTQNECKMLDNNIKGQGAAPTIHDMRRHAMVKCVMGDVGCDMAHCQNWCMRPDGFIGRNDIECGPDGS